MADAGGDDTTRQSGDQLAAAGTVGAQCGAAHGHYDDWWACVDSCGAEDAACVDACTDRFNSSHATPDSKQLAPFRLIPRTRPLRRLGFRGQTCPPGTIQTAFPMPVYDPIGPDGLPNTADDGLFIDHFQTTFYCVPVGLEPAR